MGIFQAIGKGFAESFKLAKVMLIFFIFNFAMGLIMIPFAGPENANNPRVAGIAIAVSIVSVLIFIFLQGGALALIRDLIKKGSASMAEFIPSGGKYYLKILGLFVCVILVALLIVIILALISAGVIAVANNTFTKAFIAAIVTIIAIIAAVMLLYPIYCIVIDDLGPIGAIKKGVGVSLKNFWRTFGMLIILFIVTFAIAFGIGLISAALTRFLPVQAGQVITLLINSVLQSYLSLVMMVALMAFYLALTSQGPKESSPTI